jgi:hypothetical protein
MKLPVFVGLPLTGYLFNEGKAISTNSRVQDIVKKFSSAKQIDIFKTETYAKENVMIIRR